MSRRANFCMVQTQKNYCVIMETIKAVIFDWGGVPQGIPSPRTISQVFWNALQARPVFMEAPMNSGWTKLAAKQRL